MKGVLGIDPGSTGGLAIIHKDGLVIEPMPVLPGEIDFKRVADFLTFWRKTYEFAFIERAQAMPKQGVCAMFTYGQGYGGLKAILTVLGIPFEAVPSATWSKVMHAGAGKDLTTKQRSALVVARIFPQTDFRASPNHSKPHEGMVDAALIAKWGELKR